MIKIKAVQENPKVGDIKGNTLLIENHLNLAKKEGIDLLVFSEMFLSGYPPEDLVMRDDFLDEIKKSIEQIIPQTDGISLIFGYVQSQEIPLFLDFGPYLTPIWSLLSLIEPY